MSKAWPLKNKKTGLHVHTYLKHSVVKSLGILVKLLPNCQAHLIVPEGAECIYCKLVSILDNNFGLRQMNGNLPSDQIDVYKKRKVRDATGRRWSCNQSASTRCTRKESLHIILRFSLGLTEYFHVILKVVIFLQNPRPTEINRHDGVRWTLGRMKESMLIWDFILEQVRSQY